MTNLFLKYKLQKQPSYPGVPVKSCTTWQESWRVGGHLVNPNVLFYAQVPKFLPECKCLRVAQFQSLEELMCWFCYIFVVCCFFINLYINLKAQQYVKWSTLLVTVISKKEKKKTKQSGEFSFKGYTSALVTECNLFSFLFFFAMDPYLREP